MIDWAEVAGALSGRAEDSALHDTILDVLRSSVLDAPQPRRPDRGRLGRSPIDPPAPAQRDVVTDARGQALRTLTSPDDPQVIVSRATSGSTSAATDSRTGSQHGTPSPVAIESRSRS